MISISDNLKLKLYTGAPKTLKLTFSDGTVITNESIKQGTFDFEQTLCDEEQFTFGLCHAACFHIQILYNERSTRYKGLTVNVDFGVDGINEVIRLGTFKVWDDELTDDRMYRDLTCYDVMKDILERDVTQWYASLIEDMPMTLRSFRDRFFSHVGVTQNSVTLPNDEATIQQTVIAEGTNAMSGQMVLNVNCEMNGCSGVIDNNGRFRYVFFNLTPKVRVIENGAYITGSTLTPEGFHQGEFRYKDYVMNQMGGIQLRETDTDSGAVAGSTTNAYAITGNFLTYGKGAEEKQTIVDNIYNQVKNFYYRPAQIEVRAMPWLEVGDCIEVVGEKVTSVLPILHRHMSGITAAYDVYTAKGSEYFSFNINSLTNRFEQVRQKTLEIKQSVDEVSTTMTEKFIDIDGQLQENRSLISQTATAITLMVENRTTSAYIITKINENGDSNIKIHADQVDIEGSVTFRNLIDNSVTQILGGNIITEVIQSKSGIYADLIVDELSTSRRVKLYLMNYLDPDNYIHIHGQTIQLIAGYPKYEISSNPSGGTITTYLEEQAVNRDGALLYWLEDISEATIIDGIPYINGKRIGITTNDTGFPVMVFQYDDVIKSEYSFYTDDVTGYDYPYLRLGAGDNPDNNDSSVARLLKYNRGVKLSYTTTDDYVNELRLSEDDIYLGVNDVTLKVHNGKNLNQWSDDKSILLSAGDAGLRLFNNKYSYEDNRGLDGDKFTLYSQHCSITSNAKDGDVGSEVNALLLTGGDAQISISDARISLSCKPNTIYTGGYESLQDDLVYLSLRGKEETGGTNYPIDYSSIGLYQDRIVLSTRESPLVENNLLQLTNDAYGDDTAPVTVNNLPLRPIVIALEEDLATLAANPAYDGVVLAVLEE